MKLLDLASYQAAFAGVAATANAAATHHATIDLMKPLLARRRYHGPARAQAPVAPADCLKSLTLLVVCAFGDGHEASAVHVGERSVVAAGRRHPGFGDHQTGSAGAPRSQDCALRAAAAGFGQRPGHAQPGAFRALPA